MTLETLNCNKIISISEANSKVENINIEYKLYKLRLCENERYIIFACTKDDSEMCFVGADIFRAEEIFKLISQNCVTPCTLCDVISDICRENN